MGKHMMLGAAASIAAIAAASNPVPRGLLALRADSGPSVADLMAMIEGINKAFADFKADNDKALNDRFKDVVQAEKVDRINAAITAQQTALDGALQTIAALQVGGGGSGKGKTAEQKAHATAFDRFFRKGVEAELRELEVKAALRTDSDPDGGYLVPEEESNEVDRVLGTVSVMRQLATVVTISGGVYKKLVNQGGASSGWVGERETRSETNTATLAELAFPVMELYANPAITQTLLDDARLDIGAWLAGEVAIEFAEEEGAAFISGSGVNRPRGILSYATVANASYAWGNIGHIVTGEAADFIAEDPVDPFINLVYALKQGYRQNATWLMNRTNQGKVRKFKDDQDNYMWTPPFMGGVQVAQPATFLGYPIADDDNMPDVAANAYPVAFGDFRRGYLIVDRVEAGRWRCRQLRGDQAAQVQHVGR
jgi:HK97 family phage major capsid protein